MSIASLSKFLNNKNFSLLNGNDGKMILAVGEEKSLSLSEIPQDWGEITRFFEQNKGHYIFGYLSYDLKNLTESSLTSKNKDVLEFPEAYFYVPESVYEIRGEEVTLLSGKNESSELKKGLSAMIPHSDFRGLTLKPNFSYEDYQKAFNQIQHHLKRGDIYEMNYCLSFEAAGEIDNVFAVYEKLNQLTQAPFSVLHRNGPFHLISGSPERFIQKKGQKIISQPIKGTQRRSSNPKEDEALKEKLFNDEKERAENIMIVDLVRNDLSRIAQKNSVKVEELLKVYSFKTVHQLISTISCQIKEDVGWKEILQALFPMGSMTGAPKIRAMEIIEAVENFKRGLYSGSFGYITPEGDADFNVVIRSLLYNADKKHTLAPVGGAITVQSDVESEYKECLLKAKALQEALSSSTIEK